MGEAALRDGAEARTGARDRERRRRTGVRYFWKETTVRGGTTVLEGNHERSAMFLEGNHGKGSSLTLSVFLKENHGRRAMFLEGNHRRGAC